MVTKCLGKSDLKRRSPDNWISRAPRDGFTPECLGNSYFKRRFPDNEFPERPEAGLHKSVWGKVTLSEGPWTIGFPELPQVGLHQVSAKRLLLVKVSGCAASPEPLLTVPWRLEPNGYPNIPS